MKFNKMTSYGIRVVARLCKSTGQVTTSTELSKAEDIPAGVLMKVLTKLKSAGILESHRGRGQAVGGFTLCKKYKNIDLKQLVEVLEGDLELYPICEREKYEGDYIKLYEYMEGLNETYTTQLASCKIKDML